MNNFLCQEKEAGPSSEEYIRYKRALEEFYEINKKMTRYISSDSDSETGE